MKQFLFALTFVFIAPTAFAACPPAGYDRAALIALKATHFEIANDRARNAFARNLTDCLSDPDPEIRDGIAFEALQHFLREQQLTTPTMLAIEADLEARLTAPEGQGFERPFAALALSEVARTDRIKAYLPPATRARLLEAAISFFVSVRDYRGFDAHDGWRHGVAHGSDLLLQLALNPALGKPELTRILDAIAQQIAPPEHFYIYGESERLARPILYIAQRGVFTADEWSAWLRTVAAPGPLGSWGNAFASQAGLARRHDVTAFMQVLYVNVKLGGNDADDALLPGVEAALRALP